MGVLEPWAMSVFTHNWHHYNLAKAGKPMREIVARLKLQQKAEEMGGQAGVSGCA